MRYWEGIVGLLIAGAVTGTILGLWFNWTLGDYVTSVSFFVAVIVTVLLGRKYPNFKEKIESGFANTFTWLVISGLLLVPLVLFSGSRTLLAGDSSTALQIGAFFFWGAFLFTAIWFITTKVRRQRLFGRLQRIGWLAPLWYSLIVVLIASGFFGSATWVLHGDPSGFSQATVSSGEVADFYLWHFVDAIPVIDATGTLRWEEPLKHESGWIGAELLLFKIAVIIPIVATFRGWFQYRDSRHMNQGDGGGDGRASEA